MTSLANTNLDETLEAAVVAAWSDLMPDGRTGSVHVEYRFAADHSLANLQVWTSETKGRWLLVCAYPAPGKGTAFAYSNGYRSDLLTQLLEFVVDHQTAFVRMPELHRDSLVQVQAPTESDQQRARKLMEDALAPIPTHAPMALATAS